MRSKTLKLSLLLGLFTLAMMAGSCGQPAPELETSGLSAKEVYTRLEQAMTRPGQVFHTAVRISQEAGPLSYEGKFELWVSPAQNLTREVTELHSADGDTHRLEAVSVDGVVYGTPIGGTPPKHWGLQCPEASALVSTTIACWRSQQAGETSVEAVQYEGLAAVVLATKVVWSGTDETFDFTRRLYLDAETFLPIVLQFDGTVDHGEVSTLRGRWTYENDFRPLDSLPDDFFDPASIGYFEPDAKAPLTRNQLPSNSDASSVAASRTVEPREMITIVGRPFPAAEQVASMAEARSRLAFDVKLPQLVDGWSPTAIWVSPATEPEKYQQFQIYFSNGTRLTASRQEKEPRWQAVAEGPLKLTLVEVAGHLGIGDDPEMVEIHNEKISEPGVVAWWQDGLHMALFSPTLSMDELLALAPLFATSAGPDGGSAQ